MKDLKKFIELRRGPLREIAFLDVEILDEKIGVGNGLKVDLERRRRLLSVNDVGLRFGGDRDEISKAGGIARLETGDKIVDLVRGTEIDDGCVGGDTNVENGTDDGIAVNAVSVFDVLGVFDSCFDDEVCGGIDPR